LNTINPTDSGSPIDLLLIGGVAAILFSAFGFMVNRWRYKRWAKASGTVIELIKVETISSDRATMPTYAPRVSFRTASGETAEFTSTSSSSAGPAVGDTVSVLYDPTDPKDAQLDSFLSKYGFVVAVLFLGMTMIVIYSIKKFGG
jgi:Protein of unknown function (DUF3592)